MRTKYLLAAATAVLAAAVAMAAPGPMGGGRGFAALDADNNGSVTRAEIDARAAERFAKIDANRDGFVTQAEMSAHHETMRAQWAAKAKEKAATAGARAERRAERLEKRGDRMAKRMGDHFAKRDSNGDGRISLAEFQADGGRMIERLDADKNGVVSQDEMAKAREARRGAPKR